MLNLKELEDRLDVALENESPESLKKWLNEKRSKSYLNNLGAGVFEALNIPIKEETFEFKIKTNFTINLEQSIFSFSNEEYFKTAA